MAVPMTDSEIMDMIEALGAENQELKEKVDRLEKAVTWLTHEVATKSAWIARNAGEITNSDEFEEEINLFDDKIKEILK